ncbi:MAG: hypothetical protein HY557_06305 [Euryarchaeota archaeon]|nr:hypothetical protein [Euryarchaeota archaeon]
MAGLKGIATNLSPALDGFIGTAEHLEHVQTLRGAATLFLQKAREELEEGLATGN